MAPSAHALLAPSASSRWMVCYASAYWSARAPAGDSSVYAQEGSWAHLLAERMLTGDDSGFTDAEVSAIVKAGFDPESFCEPVTQYVDYVRSISSSVLVEQALDLESVTGEPGAEGTADAVILGEDGVLHICDLKFGCGEKVSAPGNTQLLIYAGAVLASFPWFDFSSVSMHIIQPRLSHFDRWDLTRGQVENLLSMVKVNAARALACANGKSEPEPEEYHPGPVPCRWCPFRGQCGMLARYALTIAGAELPDSIKPRLDADELSFILSRADMIKKWLESISERALSVILAGDIVPGYKVVTGRAGDREWADAEKAERMLKGWKVPAEARYVKKLISPAAAEKLLKMKTLTPEQWEELSSLVSRKPGKPTLVSESDKRPSIGGKPAADAYPNESIN